MKALFAAALAAALFIAAPSSAAPPAAEAGERMARLATLVGTWRGSGWMVLRGGERKRFESEEVVESRLGGRALVIEGRHRDAATGALVHHALALVSWDPQVSAYRFSTALANAPGGTFSGTVEDGRFIWSLPGTGAVSRRFVIALDDPQRWFEYGEMSRDGGATWTRFFEMSLARVP